MPKPTTEESFALKAKGMLGEIANYLWANITGERERDFSMSDIETPRSWIDKSDPDYTPSIYSEPRSYLRAELPDVRKVGAAAFAKAKLKQGVVRQMTTKNPGYRFGAEPDYERLELPNFEGLRYDPKDIEDSTQAVLRAIDKLPDDEFRQISKIDMLTESEYAKEAAKQGSFGGFYRRRASTGTGEVAISSREPSEAVPGILYHEVSHGRVVGGVDRPMIGTLDPTDIQKGNKPLSFEDKQLYKRLEFRSRNVPYANQPIEIQARITANIMKALPTKMFKGGKVPQSVYDGIIRASAKAALMETKTVSSAASIKGTKGWKFIPEGSKSPFIMTKGETAISEKMDSAGNLYYQVRLTASLGNDLTLPDRFNTLEQAIKLANTFEEDFRQPKKTTKTLLSRPIDLEAKKAAKELEKLEKAFSDKLLGTGGKTNYQWNLEHYITEQKRVIVDLMRTDKTRLEIPLGQRGSKGKPLSYIPDLSEIKKQEKLLRYAEIDLVEYMSRPRESIIVRRERVKKEREARERAKRIKRIK